MAFAWHIPSEYHFLTVKIDEENNAWLTELL
jgi:hypothetical protein